MIVFFFFFFLFFTVVFFLVPVISFLFFSVVFFSFFFSSSRCFSFSFLLFCLHYYHFFLSLDIIGRFFPLSSLRSVFPSSVFIVAVRFRGRFSSSLFLISLHHSHFPLLSLYPTPLFIMNVPLPLLSLQSPFPSVSMCGSFPYPLVVVVVVSLPMRNLFKNYFHLITLTLKCPSII